MYFMNLKISITLYKNKYTHLMSENDCRKTKSKNVMKK